MKPNNRGCVNALALFMFVALAAIVAISFARASETDTASQDDRSAEVLEVNDKPYRWVFNYGEDMQLPELPTGCEATAAATLARMNGFYVTKTQVADAMPKSDSDFVNAFLGDPHSKHGWATSAPCVTDTLNGFFEIEEKLAAINLTGTDLFDLPVPCAVWATIDMTAPDDPVRASDGYGLYRNTHCVVLTRVGEVAVDIIDPLRGDCQQPTDQFIEIYDAMGKQAVYVADLTTILRMQRGEEL